MIDYAPPCPLSRWSCNFPVSLKEIRIVHFETRVGQGLPNSIQLGHTRNCKPDGVDLSEIADITQTYFTAEKTDIEIRPPAGFAASPAFDLKTDVSIRFKKAYENTMPGLYYGRDPLPAWNAICERVAQNRELL